MRMVMGLDRPTAGIATVNAKRYVELAAPLSEVGALLDAGAMHPGRTDGHTCVSGPAPTASHGPGSRR
jgi:hypothetical protein